MENYVEVVAALIWDNDKFMICQRPANKSSALLWEFVGGKVEKGETMQEALARECKEELDVEISVGEEYMTVTHKYPDIHVRLTLFNAKIKSGIPKLIEHNDLKWITTAEASKFEFCPADISIINKITADKTK